MANISRIGFGQVEENHLSARRTGQIYAQLPAYIDPQKGTEGHTDTSIKLLENGQFAKYDGANGCVNFTGEGEWLLVLNEVKLYDDEWRESHKDFALETKNFTDEEMTPRLFKTNVGDRFTTNCLKQAGAKGAVTTMEEYSYGDHLIVDTTGYLKKDTKTGTSWDTTTGMIWEVIRPFNDTDLTNTTSKATMPDGQPAVKIQRIQ